MNGSAPYVSRTTSHCEVETNRAMPAVASNGFATRHTPPRGGEENGAAPRRRKNRLPPPPQLGDDEQGDDYDGNACHAQRGVPGAVRQVVAPAGWLRLATASRHRHDVTCALQVLPSPAPSACATCSPPSPRQAGEAARSRVAAPSSARRAPPTRGSARGPHPWPRRACPCRREGR